MSEKIVAFFYNIDLTLFYSVNHTLHNTLLNSFMPFFTNTGEYGLLWIIISLILFAVGFAGGKPTLRKTAFLMLLALAISHLSCELLKNLFQRPRPFETLPDVNLMIKSIHSFSFPSGHAACAFAATIVPARKIPGTAWLFILLALLMAFSRVYVGVHYPSDVLAGSLLGLACGALVLYGEKHLPLKYKQSRRS